LTRTADFSLAALYAALDAQRQSRGLTWAAVAREMNRYPDRNPGHPLSASTITGTRHRSAVEGDGVLQMIRWLNRTPESFVPGHPLADDPRARLPDVPPHRILRFDVRKLHAALDAQRLERKMTWEDVAQEIRLGASTLTYLARGSRTAFPHVMRMTAWLNRFAAEFTRLSGR
jgi:hypothetical protein